MSADLSSSNAQEQSKLPLVLDGLSCVGALGGTIASVVTQQVMFATVPLSVMFALQVFNRHKQEQSLNLANQQSNVAIEQSHQVLQKIDSEFQVQLEAIHSLELDTSNHCINVFNLKNLIHSKDQAQQYEIDKLSGEVKVKLAELDTVVTKLRAIVADSKGNIFSTTDVHYKRGLNQEQLGNLKAAISDYTLVLEQDPTHAFSYLRRGLAYMETGQKQSALLDLNTAARHFFGEGDLQNYEIAKEKANAIHVAQQEAKQIYSAKLEAAVPASINTMFGG